MAERPVFYGVPLRGQTDTSTPPNQSGRPAYFGVPLAAQRADQSQSGRPAYFGVPLPGQEPSPRVPIERQIANETLRYGGQMYRAVAESPLGQAAAAIVPTRLGTAAMNLLTEAGRSRDEFAIGAGGLAAIQAERMGVPGATRAIRALRRAADVPREASSLERAEAAGIPEGVRISEIQANDPTMRALAAIAAPAERAGIRGAGLVRRYAAGEMIQGTPLDLSARGAIVTGLDIATDPTTYIGGLGLERRGAMLAGKFATEALERGAIVGGRALTTMEHVTPSVVRSLARQAVETSAEAARLTPSPATRRAAQLAIAEEKTVLDLAERLGDAAIDPNVTGLSARIAAGQRGPLLGFEIPFTERAVPIPSFGLTGVRGARVIENVAEFVTGVGKRFPMIGAGRAFVFGNTGVRNLDRAMSEAARSGNAARSEAIGLAEPVLKVLSDMPTATRDRVLMAVELKQVLSNPQEEAMRLALDGLSPQIADISERAGGVVPRFAGSIVPGYLPHRTGVGGRLALQRGGGGRAGLALTDAGAETRQLEHLTINDANAFFDGNMGVDEFIGDLQARGVDLYKPLGRDVDLAARRAARLRETAVAERSAYETAEFPTISGARPAIDDLLRTSQAPLPGDPVLGAPFNVRQRQIREAAEGVSAAEDVVLGIERQIQTQRAGIVPGIVSNAIKNARVRGQVLALETRLTRIFNEQENLVGRMEALSRRGAETLLEADKGGAAGRTVRDRSLGGSSQIRREMARLEREENQIRQRIIRIGKRERGDYSTPFSSQFGGHAPGREGLDAFFQPTGLKPSLIEDQLEPLTSPLDRTRRGIATPYTSVAEARRIGEGVGRLQAKAMAARAEVRRLQREASLLERQPIDIRRATIDPIAAAEGVGKPGAIDVLSRPLPIESAPKSIIYVSGNEIRTAAPGEALIDSADPRLAMVSIGERGGRREISIIARPGAVNNPVDREYYGSILRRITGIEPNTRIVFGDASGRTVGEFLLRQILPGRRLAATERISQGAAGVAEALTRQAARPSLDRFKDLAGEAVARSGVARSNIDDLIRAEARHANVNPDVVEAVMEGIIMSRYGNRNVIGQGGDIADRIFRRLYPGESSFFITDASKIFRHRIGEVANFVEDSTLVKNVLRDVSDGGLRYGHVEAGRLSQDLDNALIVARRRGAPQDVTVYFPSSEIRRVMGLTEEGVQQRGIRDAIRMLSDKQFLTAQEAADLLRTSGQTLDGAGAAYLMDPAVVTLLNSSHRMSRGIVQNMPEEFRAILGAAGNAHDRLFGIAKGLVTSGMHISIPLPFTNRRVGLPLTWKFHARNFVSNIYFNAQMGLNPLSTDGIKAYQVAYDLHNLHSFNKEIIEQSLRDPAMAKELRRQYAERLARIELPVGGRVISGAELGKMLRDYGIIQAGNIVSDVSAIDTLPGLRRLGALSRSMDRARDLASGIENHARVANFVHGLLSGMSPSQAAARARVALLDYNSLSPLEKTVFRRVAMFWAFNSRNLSRQLSRMALNPREFMTIEKAVSLAEEPSRRVPGVSRDEPLPPFLENQDPVRVGAEPGGGRVTVSRSGYLPTGDVRRFMDQPGSFITQQLNPLLQIPGAIALNIDPATGQHLAKTRDTEFSNVFPFFLAGENEEGKPFGPGRLKPEAELVSRLARPIREPMALIGPALTGTREEAPLGGLLEGVPFTAERGAARESLDASERVIQQLTGTRAYRTNVADEQARAERRANAEVGYFNHPGAIQQMESWINTGDLGNVAAGITAVNRAAAQDFQARVRRAQLAAIPQSGVLPAPATDRPVYRVAPGTLRRLREGAIANSVEILQRLADLGVDLSTGELPIERQIQAEVDRLGIIDRRDRDVSAGDAPNIGVSSPMPTKPGERPAYYGVPLR